MAGILILSVYIWVPLLNTLTFKRFRNHWYGASLALTAVFFLFYAFFLMNLSEPPRSNDPHEARCGIISTSVLIVAILCLLPIALVLQMVFNYLLWPKNSKA